MTTQRPLTDLQLRVLRAMRELGPDSTPNNIGYEAGAKTVRGGGGSGSGRGSGARVFGPAQQIIWTLTSLKRRGLIRDGWRRDGLSGSAYSLTPDGHALLREIDAQP